MPRALERTAARSPSPVPAAVIERLLGRREVPDQTEAHRVERIVLT
jgi:hypothetical protein